MRQRIIVLLAIFTLVFGANSTYARGVKIRKAVRVERRHISAKHKAIKYNNVTFRVKNGRYYKAVGAKHLLVAPPVGLRVKSLAKRSVIFTFRNINYYCSRGVIYKILNNSEFEVVKAKKGMIVPELPEVGVTKTIIDGETLYIYDGMIYKPVPTKKGVWYEVLGR